MYVYICAASVESSLLKVGGNLNFFRVWAFSFLRDSLICSCFGLMTGCFTKSLQVCNFSVNVIATRFRNKKSNNIIKHEMKVYHLFSS